MLVKELRYEVHRWLDCLWKSGCLNRGRVYELLQRFMHMAPDECHVARFNKVQCEKALIFAKGACELYGLRPKDTVDK